LIPIFERLLEGDEVDRFVLVTELQDQTVNDLVGWNIERLRPEMQDANVSYVTGREQQGTENAFFTIFTEREGTRNLASGEYFVRIL
jgi:hypothetical protein